jgi:ribulose-bisphosphate carboxylase large chain
LRKQLGVPERAITATATKPMGLSSKVLAKMAYDYALGGLDIVKDDHGLSDQRFAPYQERVRQCADAVAEANAKTGGKCIYFPSVTAPADQV